MSRPPLFLEPIPADTPRVWDEVVLPLDDRKVEVLLVGDGDAVVGVTFGPNLGSEKAKLDDWVHDPAALRTPREQLQAYAAGELSEFDIPLRPAGTPFQLSVWAELVSIAYGKTTSYGQVAQALGRPTAGRAVGAAVGANPIGIVVPCHRVIGSNGSLTGYAGGLENKIALLRLEGVTLGVS
jgi:methylated-DNA-[protein]-cysteine S-methyltransferase